MVIQWHIHSTLRVVENFQAENFSNELIVVSISRLKSNSFKLALAVSRSRKVSNGDIFSADGKAASPLIENFVSFMHFQILFFFFLVSEAFSVSLQIVQIYE